MAGTVSWKSLGPMLLTVTRPVAAEDLDLGPLCEDRRWQSNHSFCLGGWRPEISASCWQESHSCHLKSQTGFKHEENSLCFKKRKTNTCRYARKHTHTPLLTCLPVCCFTQQQKAVILPSVSYVLVPEMITGRQELPEETTWWNSRRTSSLITANSLSTTLCVFVWTAQLACLMFIFYFSHTIMFGHTQGPPLLPLLYLSKVLFDWFSAISSCKSTISIMLGLLRWCQPLLSTLSQLRDGWMKEGLKGEGKKK